MSPRRVRDELLSVAGRLARDGETQLKQSPENPGRFKAMEHGYIDFELAKDPPVLDSLNAHIDRIQERPAFADRTTVRFRHNTPAQTQAFRLRSSLC